MAIDEFDFDDDDLGFDDELGGLGLDMDFENGLGEKDTRTSVVRSITGGASSMFDSFIGKDAPLDTINDIADKAIPEGLSSEATGVKSVLSSISDRMGESLKEIKGSGKQLLGSIDEIVPETGILRNVTDSIRGTFFKEDEEGYTGERTLSPGEKLNAEALASVADTLGEQIHKDQVSELVAQTISENRHSDNISLLSAISANTEQSRKFDYEIQNSFYRRSLELQYKQLYVTKEHVEVDKAAIEMFKSQLESIVNNTGLPDLVKLRKTEQIKETFQAKARNNIIEIANDNFNPFKNINENIKSKTEDWMSGIRASLDSANEIGGAASTASSMSGMIPKEEMLGAELGKYLRNYIAKTVSHNIIDTAKGGESVFAAKDKISDINAALQTLDEKYASDDSMVANGLSAIISLARELTANSGKNTLTDLERKDPNDPALFDNRAYRSITQVIPDLLSKIYGEVKSIRTGDSTPDKNEIHYDSKTDSMLTGEQINTNLFRDIKNIVNESSKVSVNDYINRFVNEGKIELSNDDRTEFKKSLFKYAMDKGPTNITAITSDKFLNYFPDNMRDRLKEAGENIVSVAKQDLNYMDSYVTNMKTISNSITNAYPAIQARLKELNDSGLSNIVKDTGLITKGTTGYDVNNELLNKNIVNNSSDMTYVKSDVYHEPVVVKEDSFVVKTRQHIKDKAREASLPNLVDYRTNEDAQNYVNTNPDYIDTSKVGSFMGNLYNNVDKTLNKVNTYGETAKNSAKKAANSVYDNVKKKYDDNKDDIHSYAKSKYDTAKKTVNENYDKAKTTVTKEYDIQNKKVTEEATKRYNEAKVKLEEKLGYAITKENLTKDMHDKITTLSNDINTKVSSVTDKVMSVVDNQLDVGVTGNKLAPANVSTNVSNFRTNLNSDRTASLTNMFNKKYDDVSARVNTKLTETQDKLTTHAEEKLGYKPTVTNITNDVKARTNKVVDNVVNNMDKQLGVGVTGNKLKPNVIPSEVSNFRTSLNSDRATAIKDKALSLVNKPKASLATVATPIPDMELPPTLKDNTVRNNLVDKLNFVDDKAGLGINKGDNEEYFRNYLKTSSLPINSIKMLSEIGNIGVYDTNTQLGATGATAAYTHDKEANGVDNLFTINADHIRNNPVEGIDSSVAGIIAHEYKHYDQTMAGRLTLPGQPTTADEYYSSRIAFDGKKYPTFEHIIPFGKYLDSPWEHEAYKISRDVEYGSLVENNIIDPNKYTYDRFVTDNTADIARTVKNQREEVLPLYEKAFLDAGYPWYFKDDGTIDWDIVPEHLKDNGNTVNSNVMVGAVAPDIQPDEDIASVVENKSLGSKVGDMFNSGVDKVTSTYKAAKEDGVAKTFETAKASVSKNAEAAYTTVKDNVTRENITNIIDNTTNVVNRQKDNVLAGAKPYNMLDQQTSVGNITNIRTPTEQKIISAGSEAKNTLNTNLSNIKEKITDTFTDNNIVDTTKLNVNTEEIKTNMFNTTLNTVRDTTTKLANSVYESTKRVLNNDNPKFEDKETSSDEDAKKQLTTDELKFMFFNSPEYISGAITDFNKWLEVMGYEANDNVVTENKKKLADYFKINFSFDKKKSFKDNIIDNFLADFKGKAIMGKDGIINTFFKKTRELDRKMFFAIPKAIKGAFKIGKNAVGLGGKGTKSVAGFGVDLFKDMFNVGYGDNMTRDIFKKARNLDSKIAKGAPGFVKAAAGTTWNVGKSVANGVFAANDVLHGRVRQTPNNESTPEPSNNWSTTDTTADSNVVNNTTANNQTNRLRPFTMPHVSTAGVAVPVAGTNTVNTNTAIDNKLKEVTVLNTKLGDENTMLTEAKKIYENTNDLIAEFTKTLNKVSTPKAEKKSVFDRDGDGDRDGNWKDRLASIGKKKEKEKDGDSKPVKKKKSMYDLFKPLLIGLGLALSNLLPMGKKIVGFLSGMGSAIVKGVGLAINGIVTVLSVIKNIVSTAATGIVNVSKKIVSLGKTIGGGVAKVFKSVVNVGKIIGTKFGSLFGKVTGLGGKIVSSATGLGGKVVSAVTGLGSKVVSAVTGLGSTVVTAITSLASSIGNIISGLFSKLPSFLGGATKVATTAAKTVAKVATPVVGTVAKVIGATTAAGTVVAGTTAGTAVAGTLAAGTAAAGTVAAGTKVAGTVATEAATKAAATGTNVVAKTAEAATKVATTGTKVAGTVATEAATKAATTGTNVASKTSLFGKLKGLGAKMFPKVYGTAAATQSKILNMLKSFKTKIITKFGPKAGLKLVTGLTAKIALRFLGAAILVYDATNIAYDMWKNKTSFKSAVSKQILGFDLFDDEAPGVDDDGNIIKPDEILPAGTSEKDVNGVSTEEKAVADEEEEETKTEEKAEEDKTDEEKAAAEAAGKSNTVDSNQTTSKPAEITDLRSGLLSAIYAKLKLKASTAYNSLYDSVADKYDTAKTGANNFLATGSFVGKTKSKQEVLDMLDRVAAKTGTNANMLKTFAAVESGLNPSAKAGTSSASGLFQFIKSTWQSMLSKFGTKYNIPKDTSPFDPEANATMGAEFLKENANALKSVTKNANVTDLYLAHFLGAGGARTFLKARNATPMVSAASIMPQAASANKSIFFRTGGFPRSVADVYDLMTKKLVKQAAGHGFSSNAPSSLTPVNNETYDKSNVVDTKGDVGITTAAPSVGNVTNTPVSSTVAATATAGTSDNTVVNEVPKLKEGNSTDVTTTKVYDESNSSVTNTSTLVGGKQTDLQSNNTSLMSVAGSNTPATNNNKISNNNTVNTQVVKTPIKTTGSDIKDRYHMVGAVAGSEKDVKLSKLMLPDDDVAYVPSTGTSKKYEKGVNDEKARFVPLPASGSLDDMNGMSVKNKNTVDANEDKKLLLTPAPLKTTGNTVGLSKLMLPDDDVYVPKIPTVANVVTAPVAADAPTTTIKPTVTVAKVVTPPAATTPTVAAVSVPKPTSRLDGSTLSSVQDNTFTGNLLTNNKLTPVNNTTVIAPPANQIEATPVVVNTPDKNTSTSNVTQVNNVIKAATTVPNLTMSKANVELSKDTNDILVQMGKVMGAQLSAQIRMANTLDSILSTVSLNDKSLNINKGTTIDAQPTTQVNKMSGAVNNSELPEPTINLKRKV